MNIPFLDLKQINNVHKQELTEAFNRVLQSGWFIMGEELSLFEQKFADYCGVQHAIGVSIKYLYCYLVGRHLFWCDACTCGTE